MKDFFTKQEKLFIIFFLGGILIGSGIKIYKTYFGSGVELFSSSGKLKETESKIAEKAKSIDSLLTGQNSKPENLENKPSVKINEGETKQKKLGANSIDINNAQLDELVKLPQIGPVLAQRIIDYRIEFGSFKRIEEICSVKGIGTKKFNSIKTYIFINSKQE